MVKAPAQNSDVPDVGDTSIAQRDPRTILRRGAGDGFAEVDFVGNDGISYRARGSVRRARGRAEGKLQNSEISLESLVDYQRLGGGRKPKRSRMIERRLADL
jgi:exonuclease SbcC